MQKLLWVSFKNMNTDIATSVFTFFFPKHCANHSHWQQSQQDAAMAMRGAAKIWDWAKQMSASSLMQQTDLLNSKESTNWHGPVTGWTPMGEQHIKCFLESDNITYNICIRDKLCQCQISSFDLLGYFPSKCDCWVYVAFKFSQKSSISDLDLKPDCTDFQQLNLHFNWLNTKIKIKHHVTD